MRITFRPYNREREMREFRAWEKRTAPRTNAWKAAHAHLFVWHPWFAWRPVAVGDGDKDNYADLKGNYRWLQWVERCGEPWRVSRGVFTWYYRDIKS